VRKKRPVLRIRAESSSGARGLRVAGSTVADAARHHTGTAVAAGPVLEFGVHLTPSAWGRGIAKEAGAAVLRHAKTALPNRAVVAGHNPKNVRSRALLLGLGFVPVAEAFYPPTGLDHPVYVLPGTGTAQVRSRL
jgi:RimJ/RimL family protein N-acetyltransferase